MWPCDDQELKPIQHSSSEILVERLRKDGDLDVERKVKSCSGVYSADRDLGGCHRSWVARSDWHQYLYFYLILYLDFYFSLYFHLYFILTDADLGGCGSVTDLEYHGQIATGITPITDLHTQAPRVSHNQAISCKGLFIYYVILFRGAPPPLIIFCLPPT